MEREVNEFMVKTKEEIVTTVQAMAEVNPSDELIALLEDITDSFNETEVAEVPEPVDNSEEIATIQAECDAKCLAIESEWKAKYIARFNSNVEPETETEPDLKDLLLG